MSHKTTQQIISLFEYVKNKLPSTNQVEKSFVELGVAMRQYGNTTADFVSFVEALKSVQPDCNTNRTVLTSKPSPTPDQS